jgi:CubicO group peptidase (beta-lactamase class C family)
VGLISTAEDYLQFAQMLCNGGELNGKRLLSPGTVELMAANPTEKLRQLLKPSRQKLASFAKTSALEDV